VICNKVQSRELRKTNPKDKKIESAEDALAGELAVAFPPQTLSPAFPTP